ncbi:MAG: M48 family metallopeptidase [Desulfovermiculus sp.]
MSDVLVVDNLEFEVRRSNRRKTLGLTVDRSGELVVHAPEAATEAELYQWIEKKLLWVHRKLLQKREHSPQIHQHKPVSGENILYLGQNYRLKIVPQQDQPLQFDGQWFYLREKDRLQVAKHFQKWFQKTGQKWLSDRVVYWEPRAGASASRIVVRDLGYRWGSCGKNKVLYFNWRLLQLPVRLVDYVLVHELVHLRENNHSKEFWQLLECAMPDWKERKEELGFMRSEVVWENEEHNK